MLTDGRTERCRSDWYTISSPMSLLLRWAKNKNIVCCSLWFVWFNGKDAKVSAKCYLDHACITWLRNLMPWSITKDCYKRVLQKKATHIVTRFSLMLCMLATILHTLVICGFIFKINFLKKNFQAYIAIRVSNSLEPDKPSHFKKLFPLFSEQIYSSS